MMITPTFLLLMPRLGGNTSPPEGLPSLHGQLRMRRTREEMPGEEAHTAVPEADQGHQAAASMEVLQGVIGTGLERLRAPLDTMATTFVHTERVASRVMNGIHTTSSVSHRSRYP